MLWSIRSFIPMPCLHLDEHVDRWATSPRLGRVIGALAEVAMRNNCVKFRIMPIKSLRPDLNVREGNILDWLSQSVRNCQISHYGLMLRAAALLCPRGN